MKTDYRIFVCTNHKGKHHCSEPKGLALIARFKKVLKKKGKQKTINIQASGCLHQCKNGPAVCVHPKGVYYGNVQVKDVKKIVKKHLIKGKKVKKLAL
jgi:(2Fe-2S) ferredoxin